MMHFGLGEGFDVYLASMKDDPKTVQMVNNRNVTLLFRKPSPEEGGLAEVEIIGVAETVRSEQERQKGFELESPKSSIVRGLLQSGNSNVLDCIKVRPLSVRYRVFAEIVQGIPPTVVDFPQHAESTSEWSLLKRKAKLWAAEIRAPFLTGSIVPVVLGAMMAFTQKGVFNSWLFLLTLVGGVMMHLGTNVFNDYFDHISKDDEVNKEFVRPFSGGSRMIQLGLMSPLEVLSGAIFLFVGAGVIGVYLAWVCGWPILVIGIVGLLVGYFYTAPPLKLGARGIGELMCGLNLGMLMALGAYFVQTLALDWTSFVGSLTPGFLIAAVLYVNEFPDYRADEQVGKRTLVVRLGREKAKWGVPALFAATYLSIVIGVLTGAMPMQTLVALIAIPFALKASLYCIRFYSSPLEMVPANASTILAHMFTGILLIVGFALVKVDNLTITVSTTAILAALVFFIYWSTTMKERAMAGIRRTVT